MERTGIVIAWNRRQGSIKKDNDEIAFFSNSDILSHDIQVGSRVWFKEDINYLTPEIKTIYAKRVSLNSTKRRTVRQHNTPKATITNKYIGRVVQLDAEEEEGYIKNHLRLPTRFRISQKLINQKIQLHDAVVFAPVKARNSNEYFNAFEVYKLAYEKDLQFLLERHIDPAQKDLNDQSLLEEVKHRIDTLTDEIPLKERPSRLMFQYELKQLGLVTDEEAYLKLLELIYKYNEINWTPTADLLKKSCSDKYLIKLLLTGIIDTYDYAVIAKNFPTLSLENKRNIIIKLSSRDRNRILTNFFLQLRDNDKFKSINDHLKAILDITYRNTNTRDINTYSRVYDHLTSNLQPHELFTLWYEGYLQHIDHEILKQHISPEDTALIDPLLQRGTPEQITQLEPILKEYLLSQNNIDFDNPNGKYLRSLILFNKNFQEQFQEIAPTIGHQLTDRQRFTALTHDIKLPQIDNKQLITHYLDELDIYEKLRYLLRHSIHIDLIDPIILQSITQEALENYIQTQPWNNIIVPISSDEDKITISSFIDDVARFQDTFKANINLYQLGIFLFDSIPHYTIHHLRLWLYHHVPNSKYDYYGFRNNFNELTYTEQKAFISKADAIRKLTALEQQKQNTTPCHNLTINEDGSQPYTAYLENIFFEKNKLELCIGPNQFTASKRYSGVDLHLNTISHDHYLNQIEIKVTVKDNFIVTIHGLEQILEHIRKAHITQLFDRNESREPRKPIGDKDLSYNTDWEVVNQINRYLATRQDSNFQIELLEEPIQHIESIDGYIPGTYENTALYVIKVNEYSNDDSYAIIWNNIDLSTSRALYVFKSYYDDIKQQLHKLIHHITTYAQLRSTLMRSPTEYLHQAFKNNLGYVGNIQKTKGYKYAYDDVVYRLEAVMQRPIPILPSSQLQQRIESWIPNFSNQLTIPFTPHEQHPIARVSRSNTTYTPSKQNEQLRQLHHTLQEFNNYIHQILNR